MLKHDLEPIDAEDAPVLGEVLRTNPEAKRWAAEYGADDAVLGPLMLLDLAEKVCERL